MCVPLRARISARPEGISSVEVHRDAARCAEKGPAPLQGDVGVVDAGDRHGGVGRDAIPRATEVDAAGLALVVLDRRDLGGGLRALGVVGDRHALGQLEGWRAPRGLAPHRSRSRRCCRDGDDHDHEERGDDRCATCEYPVLDSHWFTLYWAER